MTGRNNQSYILSWDILIFGDNGLSFYLVGLLVDDTYALDMLHLYMFYIV